MVEIKHHSSRHCKICGVDFRAFLRTWGNINPYPKMPMKGNRIFACNCGAIYVGSHQSLSYSVGRIQFEKDEVIAVSPGYILFYGKPNSLLEQSRFSL